MFQGPIAGFGSARLASRFRERPEKARHLSTKANTSPTQGETDTASAASPRVRLQPLHAAICVATLLPDAAAAGSLSPPTTPRLAEEQLAANTTTKVRTRGTVPPTAEGRLLSANQLLALRVPCHTPWRRLSPLTPPWARLRHHPPKRSPLLYTTNRCHAWLELRLGLCHYTARRMACARLWPIWMLFVSPRARVRVFRLSDDEGYWSQLS